MALCYAPTARLCWRAGRDRGDDVRHNACRAFGFGLAQYNADGSLDPQFGAGGKSVHNFRTTEGNYALLRLPNGTLLAGGHTNNNAFALALYTADGSLVPSFGEQGGVATDFSRTSADRAYALALQPDGKVVAAGVASVDPTDLLNADFALARYR